MGYPAVSVVVPTYNEEKNIEECLDSLIDQTYPKEKYKIIVVDGGSTDSTREVVEQYDAVTLLNNPKKNAATGRNIGVEHAEGEYIALTDADVEVEETWLESLVSTILRKNNEVAGIGGDTRIPKNASAFVEALGYMVDTWWGGLGSTQGGHFEEEKVVESIPNCNALYKKEILRNLTYDEVFATGQDAELNHRIRKQGYTLLYTPEAVVYHKMRSSLSQWGNRMWEYGKARAEIVKKHPKSFKALYSIPIAYIISMIFLIPSYVISFTLFRLLLLILLFFVASSLIFSLSTYPKHKKINYVGRIFITYITSVICYGMGCVYGISR